MSKKLIALALLVSVAFAVSPSAGIERGVAVEDGSVSWVQNPTTVTGWYWGYDTDDGPPFDNPTLTALPAPYDIHDEADAHKLEPYNNAPYQYSLPDSFWYYGFWYEPGDYMYMSPDGWLSFDESSEDGYPDPPDASPPIPNTGDPNELIAVCWKNFNPLLTPDPSDVNRVYYMYNTSDQLLSVEWYDVVSHSTGDEYNFLADLQLGGQDRLVDRGECGVVFSYHFIHFYYLDDNGNTWNDEDPAVGIEDISGDHGVNYPNTNIYDGQVVRFGYNRIFNHDVQALAFLSPGRMVLRYTEIEPWVIVGNIGQEAETFSIILDIYDTGDETRVYHEVVSGYHLPPDSIDVKNMPCWETVGEYGTEYRKELIVNLDGDECDDNNTYIETSFVGCDDTLGYEWNTADVGPGFWSPPYGYWYTFGTSYRLDGGALVKGARVFMLQTDYYKANGMTDNPALELWAGQNGCGPVANGSDPILTAVSPTYQDGWNYAGFDGNVGPRMGEDADGNYFEDEVGAYVEANPTEGNLWVSVNSSGYDASGGGTATYPGIGMLYAPAATSCYSGGPTRSAYWRLPYTHTGSYSFTWFASAGYSTYSMMIEMFVHLGFTPESPAPAPPCYYDNPHDLSIYRFEEPGINWVPEDVPITTELALGNFGRQDEPDDGFFPVKLHIVDHTVNDGDTVYSEVTQIDDIGWFGEDNGNLDTMLVAMLPWTPEGICREIEDGGPFVDYEMIGLVQLGEVGPDLSDHCPYNDTLRKFVTCLLEHDVGVDDFVDANGNAWGEDYATGTEFIVVATVENYGYNEEHDIPVDLEILDRTADPDSVVWHAIEDITFLDWRGNDLSNPYTVEVTYPTWTTPSENWFTLECRTELVGDDCPEDDEAVHDINSGIEEGPVKAVFALDAITPNPFVGSTTVSFSVANTTNVSLKVYDISGKLVTTLVDGTRNAGSHSIKWNGSDDAGRTVAQGIYLVRMDAESFSATKKVVLY